MASFDHPNYLESIISGDYSLFSNHQYSANLPSRGQANCLVCARTFALENEVSGSLESLAICRECKLSVLEENGANVTRRAIRSRRSRRRRSRHVSSSNMEDSFSEQFSQLINLARQQQVLEPNSSILVHHHRFRSTSNHSGRWRNSDRESDADSFFGDMESNISISGYGGDSDASVDSNGIIDRDITVPFDQENFVDSDVDPMHVGIHHWYSEEDGEWEEASFDESTGQIELNHRYETSPGLNLNPQIESHQNTEDRWTMMEDHYSRIPSLLSDLDSGGIWSPLVVNHGDYVDARQFEQLLEQLAENGESRRGPPPAATSFVKNLPSVVISSSHEENGSLICAVCKDPLSINTEAKRLPCMHLYHPPCIFPWLRARNSCPVCRYEVPTDDPDYERSKRRLTMSEQTLENPTPELQEHTEETSSYSPSEIEWDEVRDRNVNQVARTNHGRGRGRWLLLAAAPIVSLVGFVLVLCFKNSRGSVSGELNERAGSRRLHGSEICEHRKRRWWSLF